MNKKPNEKGTKAELKEIRIESFEFSVDQTYLLVFSVGLLQILRDGIIVSTKTFSPLDTTDKVRSFDIIQSADTAIIVHEDFIPYQLQRQGSDTSWDLSPIVLTNIPQFDFTGITPDYTNTGTSQTETVAIGEIVFNADGNDTNGNDNTYYEALTLRSGIDLSTQDYSNATNWIEVGAFEDVWSPTRGYPRTCTFHQSRLWFGGSKSKVNSVWGSVANDFYNFDTSTATADKAIFDSLDTDQFNAVQGIFSGRDLQVFTTGGEFYNKSDIPTPEDSFWVRQTGYGALKQRPITIDGATLFVDSSAKTMRQFIWTDAENSYVSINISLLSSHLFNDIQGFDSIRGNVDDFSDFVYVVNGDGTCAVLNSMRLENIQGWTKFTTDGNFKDVSVVGKVVYFLVERDGTLFIEYLREGTYTDHNVAIFGTRPTTDSVTHTGDNVVFNGDEVVHTDPDTGTTITTIPTNYAVSLQYRKFDVIADGSILQKSEVSSMGSLPTDNAMILPRTAYSAECGINFNVSVKTMPLNVGVQGDGQIANLRKRVDRVILHLYNSLGVYVFSEFLGDRVFPVVLNTAPEPYSGIKEVYLFGYVDRLVEVEISQPEPLPMFLLSIDSEIES